MGKKVISNVSTMSDLRIEVRWQMWVNIFQTDFTIIARTMIFHSRDAKNLQKNIRFIYVICTNLASCGIGKPSLVHWICGGGLPFAIHFNETLGPGWSVCSENL